MLGVNKKEKNLTNGERFLLGCKALGGKSITELSEETQISREWIYEQKRRVEKEAQSLDTRESALTKIEVTEAWLRRFVLSLALDCRGTAEGIQRTCSEVVGVHLSVGKISRIINEAAEKAREFDEQVSLDNIRQGANDEIFQGSTPVLTGIDLESSYVYLLEPADDRSGETWEFAMEDCSERGLELCVNVSDGGTGLQTGIPKVFPEIAMQPDVFHALRPIGREVAALERKAYQLIGNEAVLEQRVKGKCPRRKTQEKLVQVQDKTRKAIQLYDVLAILFSWLAELVGFSGYSYEDTCMLAEWVLSEMESAVPDREDFHIRLHKFRRNLPQILSFIKRMETDFKESALKNGYPLETFSLFYRERVYGTLTWECSRIEYELGNALCERYSEAREEFERILRSAKRASSMVENVNGRIRTYMNLKRIVPKKFFILMKVYFNTKKYRRSRILQRVGKSPVELLTGKEYPEFLECIGF